MIIKNVYKIAMSYKFNILYLFILFLYSCNSNLKKEAAVQEKIIVGTPVTLTHISTKPIIEYVELNATSTFLQKNFVKSNLNGYIQTVTAKPGQYVKPGECLFTLITKESKSIDNKINELNPGFKFSGVNNIKATGKGYITQLNHQVGDYVQDGEQLAVISDINSFAFLLNLPYELKQFAPIGKQVELLLPDGSKINGAITSAMPTVDPASQTQNLIIKITHSNAIPENLVAKVLIIKNKKLKAISLPKAAILANDTQSEFWVMKVIDSNTAVKIPVTLGLQTKENIEILTPKFDTTDNIILTGNYGLQDTARILVVK